MKTIRDIQFVPDLKVIVRVDFNVPIKNGVVFDDTRIKSAMSTIDYLLDHGAKVILIAHIESEDSGNSLKPVAEYLQKIRKGFVFIENWSNAKAKMDEAFENNNCVLLENLRFNEGEKSNDTGFAKELASLADIYVNDAFSVCHRKHASIVGLPKYLPSYAGLQIEKEIIHLSKAFEPKHPFLFILGGAKFETKLPVLERFIDIADNIFVGGALATDIFKHRGYEVGISLVSKINIDMSKYISNPKIMLPIDLVTQNREQKRPEDFTKDDNSMDCGPKTVELLKEKILQAKFILWNGPLGIYEQGYKDSTLAVAKMIANMHGKAETIVGGGDTIAAIEENNDNDRFSFVSTAGGAMLDFLANGTLPGIEALGQ